MPKVRRRKPWPEHAKARLTCLLIYQAKTPRSLLASFVVRSTSTKNASFGWFTFCHPGGSTYLPSLSGYYSSLPYFQPKHSLGDDSFLLWVAWVSYPPPPPPPPDPDEWVNYFVGSSTGWCYTLPSTSPGWADLMRHSQIFLWLLLQVVHNSFVSFTLWVV